MENLYSVELVRSSLQHGDFSRRLFDKNLGLYYRRLVWIGTEVLSDSCPRVMCSFAKPIPANRKFQQSVVSHPVLNKLVEDMAPILNLLQQINEKKQFKDDAYMLLFKKTNPNHPLLIRLALAWSPLISWCFLASSFIYCVISYNYPKFIHMITWSALIGLSIPSTYISKKRWEGSKAKTHLTYQIKEVAKKLGVQLNTNFAGYSLTETIDVIREIGEKFIQSQVTERARVHALIDHWRRYLRSVSPIKARTLLG
ncbi:MAG: hypothetical protein NZT61_04190 [Deltaproteobacteria bacterium]|nr:hypothetical protein [Deltaproteobacteria bacterium]